jgi:hypothetical protein
VYNLKEAMLAKCYIEVLGLDRHSDAAMRMIKWKQPGEGESNTVAGDFARVVYHEIAARSTVEEGTLTVDAVNSLLDLLAVGKQKQYVVFSMMTESANTLREPSSCPFSARSTSNAPPSNRSGSSASFLKVYNHAPS